MKSYSKTALIVLVSLMAISIIGAAIVNAQATNLDIEASVSSTNKGIRQEAAYTFTITNVGSANLGSANITAIDFLNVRNLAINPSGWNITNQVFQSGSFILLSGPEEGLAQGESLSFSFEATNPQGAGRYTWRIDISQDTGPDGLASPEQTEFVNEPTLVIPSLLPAFIIFGIAAGIAFLNSGINRILISHFVGWEQYHVMQKEMNEHRAATMAAMRANDKKQIEKLKRKDSQIKNMQAKMMKPQLIQIGISFVYLLVWFVVLTPTFGNMSMAYLPGFGPISVFFLYPILSFFIGFLSSRVIGINPIEPR